MRFPVFAQHILCAIACIGCVNALQGDERTVEHSATRSNTILARTGDQPIDVADVDFFLGRRPNDGLPALSFTTRENAIHLIALQRQALMTLRAQKLAVSEAEIDNWIVAHAAPSESEATLEDVIHKICEQHGISSEKYRAHVAFRLSWPRYLEKHLTEVNLKRHFARQQVRFDVTSPNPSTRPRAYTLFD